MATAAVALTAVSTVLNTVSAVMEGKEASNSLKARANINEINAQTAAIESAHNQTVAGKQLRQKLAMQRAQQGEAGLSGQTFADTSYLQSVKSGLSDLMNIRYKGEAEAENYRLQAAYDRFSAKQAKESSKLSAITTFVGGAANTIAMGYNTGYFRK